MVQFCYIRLYLGIKNVFLFPAATNGEDGHRFKFAQLFQVLNAMQAKITPNVTVSVPWWECNCFTSFQHSTGAIFLTL